MWQLIPGKSLLHGVITIPGAMTQAPGVTPSQNLYGYVPPNWVVIVQLT